MQGWVDLVGWLHTEKVYPPEEVTHPGTNRARSGPRRFTDFQTFFHWQTQQQTFLNLVIENPLHLNYVTAVPIRTPLTTTPRRHVSLSQRHLDWFIRGSRLYGQTMARTASVGMPRLCCACDAKPRHRSNDEKVRDRWIKEWIGP